MTRPMVANVHPGLFKYLSLEGSRNRSRDRGTTSQGHNMIAYFHKNLCFYKNVFNFVACYKSN